MLTQRDLLFRLAQFAALFVMACIGLFDLASGMASSGALVLLRVPMAIATAAVWLPRHRQGSNLPSPAPTPPCGRSVR